jgi:aminodeoxyfutalosine synthase
MQIHIEDRRLLPILEKVQAGARLDFEDGLALYRTSDILAAGYMANLVRERMHGNVTWFNVNRHINPTDVCVASCKLCAFGKRAKDPKAYTWSLEEVWHRAGEGWSEAVTEFHIVGGLHPELTLDWYCEMLRGLKQRFPEVHLKAFTMVEVAYLAQRAKLSIRETLARLMDAGVDSLPGGGAEIFNERVRRIICDHKIDGAQWLEVAWIEIQLHHAVRPHRKRRRSRGPPGETARSSRRYRRLSDLHPTRVSSRQYRAGTCRHHHRISGSENDRGGAPDVG